MAENGAGTRIVRNRIRGEIGETLAMRCLSTQLRFSPGRESKVEYMYDGPGAFSDGFKRGTQGIDIVALTQAGVDFYEVKTMVSDDLPAGTWGGCHDAGQKPKRHPGQDGRETWCMSRIWMLYAYSQYKDHTLLAQLRRSASDLNQSLKGADKATRDEAARQFKNSKPFLKYSRRKNILANPVHAEVLQRVTGAKGLPSVKIVQVADAASPTGKTRTDDQQFNYFIVKVSGIDSSPKIPVLVSVYFWADNVAGENCDITTGIASPLAVFRGDKEGSGWSGVDSLSASALFSGSVSVWQRIV